MLKVLYVDGQFIRWAGEYVGDVDKSGHDQQSGGGPMKFEQPEIIDHGSIAEHTFFRCESGNSDAFVPKDFRDFPTDKFGECSSGHAS